MFRKILCGFALIVANIVGAANAQTTEFQQIREALFPEFRAAIGEDVMSEHFRLLATQQADGGQLPAPVLAHLLHTNGHYDLSAMYFDIAANLNKENSENLSNFATVLNDLMHQEPERFGESLAPLAIGAALEGAINRQDSAAAQNALAVVLADLAGEANLANAIEAARRATSLDPDDAIYWANYATLLYRSGALDEAEAALKRAEEADAASPAYALAAIGMGKVPVPLPPQNASENAATGMCNIDFECETSCGAFGIMKGPMIVTCKLHESDAQMACNAGKEHATKYNCEQESSTGFMLPGIHSGFGFCSPIFCVQVTFDGGKKVRYKITGQAPGVISPALEAKGKYSPSSGFSEVEYKTSVRVRTSGKNDASKLLDSVQRTPVSVNIQGNGGEMSVDAYETAIIKTGVSTKN